MVRVDCWPSCHLVVHFAARHVSGASSRNSLPGTYLGQSLPRWQPWSGAALRLDSLSRAPCPRRSRPTCPQRSSRPAALPVTQASASAHRHERMSRLASRCGVSEDVAGCPGARPGISEPAPAGGIEAPSSGGAHQRLHREAQGSARSQGRSLPAPKPTLGPPPNPRRPAARPSSAV